MKVLIVNDLGTDTGGAERISLSLRDELRRRGHAAQLFTSSAKPFPRTEVEADLTCFGTFSGWRPVLATMNPFAAVGLQRALARFRPDVVHLRMFHWQLSPLILPVLRRVPTLMHIVNYDLICPMNTKTLPTGEACTFSPGRVCLSQGCLGPAGLARATLQRSLVGAGIGVARNRLVANSHWVRRRLEAEDVRVDGVIWNGVGITDARPPLGNAPPTIGYAGRLVPKKGVDTLVECLPLIHREVPDARLLIAGDGPERQALEVKARTLGVHSSVSFLGHLSKDALCEAFRTLWVQAAPSRWEEPFGLVGAEAMMRGTAAVVSDTGGLSEQVISDETGYQATPGDPVSWAEALLRVLSSRENAERLGTNAREHALQHFTFARFTDAVEDAYAETLAESRSANRRE